MEMGEIVAVIGGSGFLGRHVVRHLQEEAASVEEDCLCIKEIRVLDIKDFYTNIEIEWEHGDGSKVYLKDDSQCSNSSPPSESSGNENTGKEDNCPAPVFQRVNVCDRAALLKALKGVTMVVNCSAVLPDLYHEDFGDKRHMDQVNVEGVSAILWACKEVQVRVLVHISTMWALMGPERFVDHTESSTPMVPEDQLYLKHYAIGRLKADKMVVDSNGTENKNSELLQTVVLRFPLAYGEGDCRFIPRLVFIAQACGGSLPWIGDCEEVHQTIYIGNAAWAIVLALRAQSKSSSTQDLQDVGGTSVYITDDTLPNALPLTVAPFLEPLHIKQQPHSQYIWVNRFMAGIYGLLARYGNIAQRHPQESPLVPAIMHILTQRTYAVSRMRATLGLNYTSRYNQEDSIKRANTYYGKIILK